MTTIHISEFRRAQFAELDRLTLLCENVNKSINRMEADAANLQLVADLRTYLAQKLAAKRELQRKLIDTAIG